MTTGSVYTVSEAARVDFDVDITTDTYNTGTMLLSNKGPMVWAKAASAITEGQLCHFTYSAGVISATPSTTALVSTTRLALGVAHKAIASASYGWFFVGPFHDVQVVLATTISADAAITTTTTGGTGGAGGTAIAGLTANASSGSGGLTSCRSMRPLGVGTGS